MQHDRQPDTVDQSDHVITKNTSEGNDVSNAENPTGQAHFGDYHPILTALPGLIPDLSHAEHLYTRGVFSGESVCTERGVAAAGCQMSTTFIQTLATHLNS